MSFVVELDMDEGESTFFEGDGEFDEEIESGLTKVTPGNNIFLGYRLEEAISDCNEVELRSPSFRSGCESISTDLDRY